MNKEEVYEQYHHKGGTYIIPTEVFNDLLEENKWLEEQINYLKNGEYVKELRWERDFLESLFSEVKLSKENSSIKEVLKENTRLSLKIEKAIDFMENELIPKNPNWEYGEVICSDLPLERIKPLYEILKGKE